MIEALALGKPAVVTDVGGLSEVVRDGEEGYVVPPGDPDALAARDRRAAPRSGAPVADGERGRDPSRRLRHPPRRCRMEQVYEELLS